MEPRMHLYRPDYGSFEFVEKRDGAVVLRTLPAERLDWNLPFFLHGQPCFGLLGVPSFSPACCRRYAHQAADNFDFHAMLELLSMYWVLFCPAAPTKGAVHFFQNMFLMPTGRKPLTDPSNESLLRQLKASCKAGTLVITTAQQIMARLAKAFQDLPRGGVKHHLHVTVVVGKETVPVVYKKTQHDALDDLVLGLGRFAL